MSTFIAFAQLGFHHITDLAALDHILFLLALAAIYRGRDWRDSLWVITAFTVGHSVTLALAVTRAVVLPTSLIEFLIPVTIVITGLENLAVRDRSLAPLRGRYRPVFAGAFGLVHGAGFANYLQTFFEGGIAVPLFGFNVGIELGQIAVLGLAALALAGVDRMLGLVRATGVMPTAHRVRVVGVSAAVVLLAARMAAERLPW